MFNADTTPKAPRQCKYIESALDNGQWNRPKPMRAVYNTPMRRSLLLCSWLTNEFAKFTNRQNKSVQLRLICIYVCPTSAHRGFRYGYRRYKDNTFILETTLFGWKSMILKSDLTLLNMNMSKNSTFAWFFLLKSLYYQWLFVSLHRQFPPSLSTMLKCVGLFCIYTFTLKIR